jgi:predicted nucleotidyltransferase
MTFKTACDLANTGLNPAQMTILHDTLARYPQIETVYLFGSRAKGNYKIGSDVDLAIAGKQVDYSLVNNINYELNEETVLPYFFDIILFNENIDPALRQHISEHGIILK